MIRVLGPTPWVLPLFTGFRTDQPGQDSDSNLPAKPEPHTGSHYRLPAVPS